MYSYIRNKTLRRKEGDGTDTEAEEEEVQEEDEILTQLENVTNDDNDDNTSVSLAEELAGDAPSTQPITAREANALAQANDADFVEDEEEDDDDGDSNSNPIDTSSVPDSFFFPGYMAFIAWGPFCEKLYRLRTVLLNGLSKKDAKSRAQMRKEDKKTKASERAEDAKNERGLTTDQLINLQANQIQKQKYDTTKMEVAMAGLSMQNQILNTMIVGAEKGQKGYVPQVIVHIQHGLQLMSWYHSRLN